MSTEKRPTCATPGCRNSIGIHSNYCYVHSEYAFEKRVQEIASGSDRGCLYMLFHIALAFLIIWAISAFVITTLVRLDKLEKAAGIERVLPMDKGKESK